MLMDTHCHLDDSRFDGRLEQLLAEARRAGVTGFLVPGVSPDGWDAVDGLRHLQGVEVAFGVHPLWAHQWSDSLLPRLRQLASHSRAIGEIGLDYQSDGADRELQQKVFRSQLQLAVEIGRPVLIHCRRAFQDLLAIMEEEKASAVGGIMHAFSGSVETARRCIALGFAIGVGGAITWSNAVKPVQVARDLPLKHLVLETDAPDLTPEPHRGKINEPAFLPDIASALARIKDITMEGTATATTATARRVLGLP